jgi:hypothetical protein
MLFGETVAVYCDNHMKHTNREREEETIGEVVRDTTFRGWSKKETNYISGFEGSQTVPACPSSMIGII